MEIISTEYRGFTLDIKERVEGYYCKVEGKHYIIPDDAGTINNNGKLLWGFVEVDPETVGQFTTKYDKNERKIYGAIGKRGGDILKDDTGEIGVVRFGELPLDKSGDCVCTYPAFYVECLGKLGQAPTYECVKIGDWMEIIGTQAEDSKLLEK